MRKQSVLTIMCGLPRSGKSTWLRNNKGYSIVVCPDVVRKEIFGHQWFASAEGFVWAFAESMVKLLLLQEKDVVVDATALTMGSRSRWINLGERHGAHIRIVWVKTPLEDVLERNRLSPKNEQIPEDKLKMMSAVFREPGEFEEEAGLEIIIYQPRHRRHSNELLRKKEKGIQKTT